MNKTPVYTQLVLRPAYATVSGGIDGDEGGAPPPAEPTPPPAGGPAQGASNADLGVGGGEPVLSAEAMQAELRRARDEAAERRVALKRFEQAFEGYEPDEVDAALEMYRAITQDPATAYERFQDTTERIRKHLEETGQLSTSNAKPGEPQYLTREDLAKIEAERAQEAAVHAILQEAKSLGYEEGSAAHQHLLFLANKATGGDLKKAHEQITAEIAAIEAAAVQRYVDSLSQPKHPPIGTGAPGAPAQGGAQAPAEGGKFDAKKSALARLTAMGF